MAGKRTTKRGGSLASGRSGERCPGCGGLHGEISDEDEAIASDKAAVARALARKHFDIEAGLKHVIRFSGSIQVESSPGEPIKLLEVNENTVPAGVMPLAFAPLPASGIRYPSVIVEVTPEEYELIQKNELKLPKGWEQSQELPGGPVTSGG